MAAVQNTPFLFSVVALNAAGDVITPTPLTDVVVTSNNGTVSVNPDGTHGVDVPATAGPGALVLTATAAGFSATDTEDVAPDVSKVVASIKIVPA